MVGFELHKRCECYLVNIFRSSILSVYKNHCLRLYSKDNGLKKDSAESMKQFIGRVNVALSKTISSLFNNHSILFKTFTDKFPAIIKSFQWIGMKSPEKRNKVKNKIWHSKMENN